MNKIVHVMVACFYKNGFGYQENILPAKHKELGYDVSIITYNKGGDASYNEAEAPVKYINPDGIPVYVLKSNNSLLKKVPFVNMFVYSTCGLYKQLEKINPDIIFMHGINMPDNLEVIRYKQHHAEIKLFADNHSDYYNAPVRTLKQKIYRRVCGRRIGTLLGKWAEKIWGVTPWRVIYQQEIYGVPPTKSALLVMGGDENKIRISEREEIRDSIRTELKIPKDAFVIITGGKIDRAKNIHILVDAINDLNNDKLYLIIFGRYEKDMIDLKDTIVNKNIKNIGWIDANETYDYFLASDLAVFPGTHSVLWEQACATGLPALFKDWQGGFNHVDVGGNCLFIKDVNKSSLMEAIDTIYNNHPLYEELKHNAETKARKEFSYIEIAKRSIGLK